MSYSRKYFFLRREVGHSYSLDRVMVYAPSINAFKENLMK